MNLPWSKPKPRPSARRPASRSRRRPAARRPPPRRRRDARELVERPRAAPLRRHRAGAGRGRRLPRLRPLSAAGTAGGSAAGSRPVSSSAAGRVAYVVPIALAAWGAALIARPLLRAPTALNAGGVLMLAALLLGFAAETAGLGPDRPSRGRVLRAALHGRARGRHRRGAVLGLDQPLPASRRPHPRRADVRLRRCC